MNLRAQADAIFGSLLWFKTEFGGSFSHFFSRPSFAFSGSQNEAEDHSTVETSRKGRLGNPPSRNLL